MLLDGSHLHVQSQLMLDLLSDVLFRLNIKGTLYFRTAFTPPWGLEVPAFANVARFHFVHRGECYLRAPETGDVVHLRQGDIAIIPHGAAHHLLSDAKAAMDVLPLDTVLDKAGYKGKGVLIHGGEALTDPVAMICGHISFEGETRHPIFERLPPVIHLRDYGRTGGDWMSATLKMIAQEKSTPRPGGDLIALKMAEAVFAQCIRTFMETEASKIPGLKGFANVQLQRALNAFHASPAAPWTVETLAQAAGLSRTGFAQCFSEELGMTPLQYMTTWRMQIARQALRETGLSLADVALQAGYTSEAAFSRAFKRESGQTPAAYRKRI